MTVATSGERTNLKRPLSFLYFCMPMSQGSLHAGRKKAGLLDKMLPKISNKDGVADDDALRKIQAATREDDELQR